MTKNTKKLLKILALSVFFIIIVVYAFFRSRDLIFGVKIRNVNIIDGSTVTNSTQEIKGNAKNAVNLRLDGREISIDRAGNFDETIALLLGYNTIQITAKDKFGNSDEKDYKLILATP